MDLKEQNSILFWDEMKVYFNENSPIIFKRLNEKLISETVLIPIRQLHKDHPDTHYCTVLFQYLREFAILYQQHVLFIYADNKYDKYKVSIEKGINTSTGICNRKTMVFQETPLIAYNHDFTKLSLTPSVIFFYNIFQSIENSFYSEKVFVLFKDKVFQPSSAIRYTTEFYNTILTHHFNNIPPILCLYTDDSSDHRTIFGSVQISLICLFLHENFDILIAMRTALHHS
ncbi:hypothetical protein RhiirA5_412217 [Rhizophagus irregularis]|uniref:Uncharacterized protein n=1 Tax=Rhizophagus irregularis TaxID=588596 RepID=A0A2N0PZ87_9GLOM|nr:hypothetical protein RhiirA5_412217 [Rhizophagus irregularis]